MSAQNTIAYVMVGEDGSALIEPTVTVNLIPQRERSGVFEYAGEPDSVIEDGFFEGSKVRLTASLRPGVGANHVTGIPRIKRRMTVKVAAPIGVLAADGINEIADYINVDVVISAPVEASHQQVRNAYNLVYKACFDGTPLEDMLVEGNEPY